MIAGCRYEATQDVDEMLEAEASDLWERLNQESQIAEKLKLSADDLKVAADNMWAAMNQLGYAVATLAGTPAEDVVQSYANQIEDLMDGISHLQRLYERGEQE